MDSQEQFTIDQFYKCISQGKLVGGKCTKCAEIHLPPRPLCNKCFSGEFERVEIPARGQLLTYTVIHVAPPQFQHLAPYAVGILQLEGGLRIPGMIKEVDHKDIRIGMELAVQFDKAAPESEWPKWTKYYFKPTVPSV